MSFIGAKKLSTYTPLPIEEISKGVEVLSEKYLANKDKYAKIKEILANVDIDEADQGKRKRLEESLINYVKPYEQDGNWEYATNSVIDASREISTDKELITAMKEKQKIDKFIDTEKQRFLNGQISEEDFKTNVAYNLSEYRKPRDLGGGNVVTGVYTDPTTKTILGNFNEQSATSDPKLLQLFDEMARGIVPQQYSTQLEKAGVELGVDVYGNPAFLKSSTKEVLGKSEIKSILNNVLKDDNIQDWLKFKEKMYVFQNPKKEDESEQDYNARLAKFKTSLYQPHIDAVAEKYDRNNSTINYIQNPLFNKSDEYTTANGAKGKARVASDGNTFIMEDAGNHTDTYTGTTSRPAVDFATAYSTANSNLTKARETTNNYASNTPQGKQAAVNAAKAQQALVANKAAAIQTVEFLENSEALVTISPYNIGSLNTLIRNAKESLTKRVENSTGVRKEDYLQNLNRLQELESALANKDFKNQRKAISSLLLEKGIDAFTLTRDGDWWGGNERKLKRELKEIHGKLKTATDNFYAQTQEEALATLVTDIPEATNAASAFLGANTHVNPTNNLKIRVLGKDKTPSFEPLSNEVIRQELKRQMPELNVNNYDLQSAELLPTSGITTDGKHIFTLRLRKKDKQAGIKTEDGNKTVFKPISTPQGDDVLLRVYSDKSDANEFIRDYSLSILNSNTNQKPLAPETVEAARAMYASSFPAVINLVKTLQNTTPALIDESHTNSNGMVDPRKLDWDNMAVVPHKVNVPNSETNKLERKDVNIIAYKFNSKPNSRDLEGNPLYYSGGYMYEGQYMAFTNEDGISMFETHNELLAAMGRYIDGIYPTSTY